MATLPPARLIVYVDGFNLYYGAVKHTPHKWLDLQRYFSLIRPHDDVQLVRYFTAIVNGGSKTRQETFLRALSTTPKVDVVLGRFKLKSVKCGVVPACVAPPAPPRMFQMPEEKRTDVNIAVYMLDDAYRGICDHMVLVSGDSDLVPALRMIRTRFPGIRTTVYVPARAVQRSYAVELRTAAHVARDLPLNLLPKAQFPVNVPDGLGGFIVKPASW